jgi:hypothetical protein
MISPEEIQAYAENDRQAKEEADRGGARPKLEPITVGIATAIGVFVLLDLFAAVTLPDRETAFWPIVTFTIICAGGAAAIPWSREAAWRKRYHKALDDIRAAKRDR